MKNMNLKKAIKIADSKMPSKYKVKDNADVVEKKFRDFLSWYDGNKVDEVDEAFLKSIGWDYLEDETELSLKEVANIFNNNLDKMVKFTQEDMGNAISIDWDLDGEHFSVDSIKKIQDSRKVKDGFSNNPNYVGDWFGDGQIDFNAIINPEDDGDIYMVKLWCGSGYVLDVYLCKANSAEEAMDIVFDWSFNNEGKNEMVFEYSYLRAECVEDFYDEYGLKPSDFGGDYSPSISELCDEINRLMDKADEDTMNGNLNNGFNLYESGNDVSAAEKLFDEYLINWNLNEIDSEENEGHYPVKSYLLSKDEGNCNAILLKTRTTRYGENIIECKEIDTDEMGEYGINYEEYEERWFDINYIMDENGLFAREENFFVGKVPEDVLAENGYGEVSDSRRVSDSDYEENGKLGLEIRQWTQSESPSYTDVVDRLKSYGYSYVFKISKGKKVYEFWKLNNSDYGVTIVCVGDSVINAIREDYDSFLQGA